MLSRTQHTASRLLTSTSATTAIISSRITTSATPLSSSIRYIHHSAQPLAAAQSAASHSSHSDASTSQHADPRVLKHLNDPNINGWFLGELPGYKGDALPGGASRSHSQVAGLGIAVMTVAVMGCWWIKGPTNSQVWAKEYVLNVEKFKVPDKADLFGEKQQ